VPETSETNARITPQAALIFVLIYAGLLLLPFSTGASDKSVVISFGLPFFLVAGFLIIMYLFREGFCFAPQLRATLFISTMFIGIITVTSFFASNVIASFARVLPNLMGYLIFLFILSFVSADIGNRLLCFSKMTQGLAISGAILALYFAATFFIAVKNNSLAEVVIQRYTGGLMSLPWGASNVVVAPLLIPLFAQFARYYLSERNRIVNFIVTVSIIVAVIISQSRTVLFLLIISFIGIAVMKKNLKLLIVLLLVTTSALFILYQFDIDTLKLIFELRTSSSEDLGAFDGRSDLWRENIHHFMLDPISFSGFSDSSSSWLGVSSHNILLTTLVQQGIAGLFIFILLVGNYIYCGMNAYLTGNDLQRKIVPVLILGMTMMFINLQFEDANFTQQYTIYFWIYFGISSLTFFLDANHPKVPSTSGKNSAFKFHQIRSADVNEGK